MRSFIFVEEVKSITIYTSNEARDVSGNALRIISKKEYLLGGAIRESFVEGTIFLRWVLK